jgi:hypothetical protein
MSPAASRGHGVPDARAGLRTTAPSVPNGSPRHDRATGGGRATTRHSRKAGLPRAPPGSAYERRIAAFWPPTDRRPPHSRRASGNVLEWTSNAALDNEALASLVPGILRATEMRRRRLTLRRGGGRPLPSAHPSIRSGQTARPYEGILNMTVPDRHRRHRPAGDFGAIASSLRPAGRLLRRADLRAPTRCAATPADLRHFRWDGEGFSRRRRDALGALPDGRRAQRRQRGQRFPGAWADDSAGGAPIGPAPEGGPGAQTPPALQSGVGRASGGRTGPARRRLGLRSH